MQWNPNISIFAPMWGWKPLQRALYDKSGLHGRFEFVLADADGEVLDALEVDNLVVNAGKASVARRMGGITEDAFTFLAIGTGSTAPALSDTTLQTEITTGGGARAAATVSNVTTDVTNDSLRLVYTWTFSSTFAVTECGVFNLVSAGDMLCRATFTAINVVSTNTLQATYTIDVD